MNTKQHLAELAKRVDRELGKVNRQIDEFGFDMDAVVEEVLDSIELDGREITCNSTPDAPEVDIDTEALTGTLGDLILAIDAMPEEEDGEPVTGLQLSTADAVRVLRALSDARARLISLATTAIDVAEYTGAPIPVELNQFGDNPILRGRPFGNALANEVDALDALHAKVQEHRDQRDRVASMP